MDSINNQRVRPRPDAPPPDAALYGTQGGIMNGMYAEDEIKRRPVMPVPVGGVN